MTGLGPLLAMAVRRDRRAVLLTVAGTAALVLLSAASLHDLYPTAADRARFAAGVGSNPALVAIRGPARALETTGGALSWQVGWFAGVLAAIASILLVGRHARGDEERGRTELVLAGPVARAAPLAAGVAVAAATDVLLAGVLALGLIATGLPAGGALAFGLAAGGVGLVFAGVAAVTAQLAESARAAGGLAAAVLGAAYVLRAAGDTGDGTLSWFSPIGWSQAMRAFAGERWWPLALSLAATAGLLALAGALLVRRDHGAGLLRAGPGAPAASPALRRPAGLALRLQRGSLLGWGAGIVALGAAYGALGRNVQDLLDTSPQVQDLFTRAGGGSVTDAFFATGCLTLGLVAGGLAVQGALRPRGEELAGHAEPLLATALSRVRWAGSHLAVAMAGSALVLLLAGAAMGAVDALRGGGAEQVWRLAGAALAQAPAVWVLAALALAVASAAPRAAMLAWAPAAFCFAVGMLGPLLGLPGWLEDLSPFGHVPQVPAHAVEAAPLVALAAIAAALAAAGLAALRARDLSPG